MALSYFYWSLGCYLRYAYFSFVDMINTHLIGLFSKVYPNLFCTVHTTSFVI